jgi:signal transduction histidine kinase
MTQTINPNTDQVALLDESFDLEERTIHIENVQRLAGIGVLTIGIAQELANLLSIVSTASISLRHELQQQQDPADDIVEYYLGLIERNAFRADQIVSMLQGYGSLDAHQMANTDVEAIMRDVMILIERQFRDESDIQVKMHIMEEAPSFICDHQRIVQLLVNLLLNTRDSLQETGGLIEVTVKPEHHDPLGNENGSTKEPMEGVDRIAFTIFSREAAGGAEEIYRSGASIKTKRNGAGLGLSVAREIVRQHHGDIQFSNNKGPGEGASVIVILPVKLAI